MGELGERYWGGFLLCSILCGALLYVTRCNHGKATPASSPTTPTASSTSTTSTASDNAFASFQRSYLAVYFLAMFADWLQGPYVYQLYLSYGYSDTQIAQLFIAGFLSSMLFGTVTASLADKWGRKFMSLAYAVTYVVACLTKLNSSFWVLMLGRLFSGIATSLLFAVFESWMVCEHMKRGFDAHLLSQTFGLATFGNGLCAIFAGLVANLVSNQFGYVAPFIVALVPLITLMIIVGGSWTENYGDKGVQPFNSFLRAVDVVRKDSKIMALGAAQALYEGAMYCFVLVWTPTLRERIGGESSSSYLGLVFSAFMVCMMIGSMIFQIVSVSNDRSASLLPFGLHAVACIAMLVAAVGMSNKALVYMGFLLFEMTVGIFYPAYGQIKSSLIPEEVRSSVMTLFRVPLNILVMIVLLEVEALSLEIVLLICAGAHGLALVCFGAFYRQYHSKNATQYSRLNNTQEVELKGRV